MTRRLNAVRPMAERERCGYADTIDPSDGSARGARGSSLLSSEGSFRLASPPWTVAYPASRGDAASGGRPRRRAQVDAARALGVQALTEGERRDSNPRPPGPQPGA